MAEHYLHDSGDTAKAKIRPHHQNAWPFITAVGLTLAFVGLIPLTQKNPSGLMFLSMGVLLFLMGLSGWLAGITREHAAVASSGAEYENPRRARWLVSFLILSEVFLFATLFASYFYLRNHDFTYSQSAGHFYLVHDQPFSPLSVIVILNTVFLVTSSFVLHFAERNLKRGKPRLFRALLGLAIILGATFVCGQIYEFGRFFFVDGFTISSGPFGATFFLLTGLHALHVSAGVLLMSYLFSGSFFGQFSDKRHTALSVVSIYWHFVDAVWIVLVGILYLRVI